MKRQTLIAQRSLEVAAPCACIWTVLTEPQYLRQWMAVVPEFDDDSPLRVGTLLTWRNTAGQAYLVGRITALEPRHRWVMELHAPDWPREALAGEVTYGFRLSETRGGVRIDFRIGDLAIDPDGQAWRDTYARSQELQRIAELAQALAARKRAQDEVLTLIRCWERAIQAGDMAGILAHHTEDIVMFDVPKPLQVFGLDAYRQTWELFFRYGAPHPDLFVIEDLRVTAGVDVAFATGLLRIGGSPSPVCRLTLGLVQRDGRWLIAHEHHSAPHALEDQEARS